MNDRHLCREFQPENPCVGGSGKGRQLFSGIEHYQEFDDHTARIGSRGAMVVFIIPIQYTRFEEFGSFGCISQERA